MYFSHLVLSLGELDKGSTSLYLFPYLSVLFLPYERVNVVLVALICVPHDLGCVVEMYWLPIGRRSSDASRRPSIIPPLMRATYHLIVIDDFLRSVHPSIPRLPSPHIPCTYLLLLSLSFIACCFVIPPLFLQRSVQSALYLAP